MMISKNLPLKANFIYAYGYEYNDHNNMGIYKSPIEVLKAYCKSVNIDLGNVEPKDNYMLNNRIDLYRYKMTDINDPTTLLFSEIVRDGRLKDLLHAYNIPYLTNDYSSLDNSSAYTTLTDKVNKCLSGDHKLQRYSDVVVLPSDARFINNRVAEADVLEIKINNNFDIGIVGIVDDFLDSLTGIYKDDKYIIKVAEEYDSEKKEINYRIKLCANKNDMCKQLVFKCNKSLSESAVTQLSNVDFEKFPDDCQLDCTKGFRRNLMMTKSTCDCRGVCKNFIINKLEEESRYEQFMNSMINESSVINKLFDTINITVDKNGDIIVNQKEYDSFDQHFKKSTKLLALYKKNQDFTAIKNELCKVSYMIRMIELYHLRPTSDLDERKKQEKLLDLRSVMINAFNYYLSYVIQNEKDFDFQDYFNDSKYGKSYKINVEGFGKLAKKIIKIFI